MRWLLLHGTPLTPAVWSAVRRVLEQRGTVVTPAVVAERDTVSGPATMEAMHHRLAGSEFTVLGGAWHMSIFTDTDRLAGLLSH